ncbi:MAG: ion channel [Bacillota bacterium]
MYLKLGKMILYYIVPIISPTYFITEKYKNHILTSYNQNIRQKIKKFYNHYFFLSWIFFGLLLFWPDTSENFPFLSRIIFFLITYYSISRAIEIFLDFLIDSIEKMKKKPLVNKGLTYSDRYIIALKIFIELIIDYGIIYYAFSTNFAQYLFKTNQNLYITRFDSIFEAVYLSVSTITILGFGDIYPTHFITQFFSIFEVLTGVFILIVTFTIYVNLNFTENKKLNKIQNQTEEAGFTNTSKIQILIIILIIIFAVINIYRWIQFK